MLIPRIQKQETVLEKRETELLLQTHSSEELDNMYQHDPPAWLPAVIIVVFFTVFCLMWVFAKCYRKRVRAKIVPNILAQQKKKRAAANALERVVSTSSFGNLGTPHAGNRVPASLLRKPSVEPSSSGSNETLPARAGPVVRIREPPPAWTPLTLSQTREGRVLRENTPVDFPPEFPTETSLPTYEQIHSEASLPLSSPSPVLNSSLIRPRMVDAETPFTGWEQHQDGESLPVYEKYERQSSEDSN